MSRSLSHSVTLTAAVVAVLAAVRVEASSASIDYDGLRSNVNAVTIQSVQPNTDVWVSQLQPNGTFAGVDYTAGCNSNRAVWGAADHWTHIQDMAVSWASGKDSNATQWANSSALLNGTLRAMDFWFSNDYTNTACDFGDGEGACPCSTPGLWAVNWWWNVIDIPQVAGTACVLLAEHLNATQIAGCERIGSRAYRAFDSQTGANLIDVAVGGVYYGIVGHNDSAVTTAFAAGNSALQITSAHLDGIKVDGTFFQHSGLLASGSYGPVLYQGFLQLQSFAQGSDIQPSAAEQEAFLTAMNGSQWMLYTQNSSGGAYWDYSATGRSISRPDDPTTIQFNVSTAVQIAAGWSAAQGESMAAIAKNIQTDTGTADSGPLNGNRLLYYGDYMVHRRDQYVITLKMTSDRVLAEECVNSENKLGFHLSDGAVYTYLSGDEYIDIFPTWDWNLIPGTTVDYNGTPNSCTPAYKGANAFAGGVSDGSIGVAAMNYTNPVTKDFSFAKSWFFLDDFYVVLGSNITESRPNPVFSTLDQRRLNGNVYVDQTSEAATTGIFPNVSWVHHDNIGYGLLGAERTLNLSTAVQTGTWQSIGAESGTVSMPVFNAKVAHGVCSDCALGYAVFPGMDVADFQTALASTKIQILRQDDTAHAISVPCQSFVGAVFWRGGSVQGLPLFGTNTVAVASSTGLIVASVSEGNSWTLLVADPTQALTTANLTVTLAEGNQLVCPSGSQFIRCSTVGTSTNISLQLPGGAEAGSSMQGIFSIA